MESFNSKQPKIRELLNKDIKEFNGVLLSFACICFLVLVGLISYKASSSYAIFTDTVEGEKLIEFTVEQKPFYSMGEDTRVGTSIQSISGYESNYTNLYSDTFLKHIVNNNNEIERNELCFIHNNMTYCQKQISPAEYEATKNKLYELFGEENCYINIPQDESEYISAECSDDYVRIIVDTSGAVYSGTSNSQCWLVNDDDVGCWISEGEGPQ